MRAVTITSVALEMVRSATMARVTGGFGWAASQAARAAFASFILPACA